MKRRRRTKAEKIRELLRVANETERKWIESEEEIPLDVQELIAHARKRADELEGKR